MFGCDYGNKNDTQIRHEIIQKHRELLSKISRSGTVSLLCDEPKRFFLLEACDGYYYYDLNKADCLELSEIFREIAEEIED